MTNILRMFSERKEQLLKQESIDNTLSRLNSKCPDIVSEYLLLQRKITRNQQYAIINTSFIYIYDEMQTQLNVNKQIMNSFFMKPMTCEELKTIRSV